MSTEDTEVPAGGSLKPGRGIDPRQKVRCGGRHFASDALLFYFYLSVGCRLFFLFVCCSWWLFWAFVCSFVCLFFYARGPSFNLRCSFVLVIFSLWLFVVVWRFSCLVVCSVGLLVCLFSIYTKLHFFDEGSFILFAGNGMYVVVLSYLSIYLSI